MLTLAVHHRFDLEPKAAVALQKQLRGRVVRIDRLAPVRTVAAVDVGFAAGGRRTRAAVVVLGFPGLEPVGEAVATVPTSFPYIPGLLSFREIPAVLAALACLPELPDLILCDGQGYAHPRRFGLACHLGVVLDLPCIGVAKSCLLGTYREPPQERMAWSPLMDGDEQIGAVLRTRGGVRPVFVSIGHRISLASAIDYVERCVTRYRLPEPMRLADRLASARSRRD
ncbi:MAG: deoxyribonuclease V [Gammaproteobacteria bacterium]|nr:deoxyribonuclease V [Gammaproteobacteria bacterium]MCG3143745.1 Endonuclease V [Gammaproteobacteria bacterium]